MTQSQPGSDGIESPVAATSPLQERIPARHVARLTGLSQRTVIAWSGTGKNGFPSGLHIPDAGWFFISDEIRAWVTAQEVRHAATRGDSDAQSS